MSVKFSNNAFGTLSAGITNSATSITLSSGQGARFPSLSTGEYFYATLIDTSNNLEVIKVTARSSDVLTATRAQESTTARAFAIGDRVELRVTAQGLTDAANPYDKDTSSTGSFALPSGTTAQQPTAADTEGHIRYDTDDNVVYFSNGTNWLKISAVLSTLSSVTGVLYAGFTSTLTLTGKGFQTSNLVVNFTQSSDSIDEDVTVTPASDTSATVTVPAAVYNNVTAGNVVTITVTNSDGIESAGQTITAVALPSGGTVTTSGSTRTHKFTSSGSFVNTVNNLSLDVLIVGGGGAGGASLSGGGGGGGVGYATGLSKNAGTYTITVGAGGAGPNSTNVPGGNGGSSSAFGQTITGGSGAPSRYSSVPGNSSANGGGGSNGTNTRTGSDGTKPTAISGFTTYGGFDGGDVASGAVGSNNYPGAGGAGAGGNGESRSSSSSAGGNGGNGVQNNILGTNYYWAGGGGGSSYTGSNGGGNGGLGGGGGGSCNTGTAGTGGGSALNTGGNGTSGNGDSGANDDGGAGGANTGGGGGAASHEGDNLDGDGGSGIVVIKYTLS